MVGLLSLLIKTDAAANVDLTYHVTQGDVANCLQEYKISLGEDGDELERVLAAIDETEQGAVNYLHVLDAITGSWPFSRRGL